MGYLDDYAASEAQRERRERQRKQAFRALVIVVVVAGLLYYWFKNYREEDRVKQFLATLERGDYPAAYAFWGCRVESPCANYDYKSFLEDWGSDPPSKIGKLRSYRLGASHESGSGVIIAVAVNDRPAIKLWVEKKDGMVGFAPP